MPCSCLCACGTTAVTYPQQVYVGNTKTVTCVVLGVNGLPFDPIVVNAKVLAPDGTVTVLTTAKTAAGTYAATATISQLGPWLIWFYNTTDFPFDTGQTYRVMGTYSGHP